jgi:formate/nitrite transporter
MDYVTPQELTAAMVESGAKKSALGTRDMLIRGALSGAILGFATSLADTVTVLSNPVVGDVLFPVGFIMIVLLNLELVTGAFALLPVGAFAGRVNAAGVLRNWVFVYIGNFIGALIYAFLFAAVNTKFFSVAPDAVGAKVMAVSVAKTAPYIAAGGAGWLTCFTKAILCNWMVTLGSVMGLVSRSVIGKIFAAWMPIMGFFAQGFEHCVVNMFAVPCGILLGAPVSVSGWLLFNQLPATLGNLVGGAVLTGAALYFTYKPVGVGQGVAAE